MIPAVTYAIVFAFTSVLITVEIPQLFVPKFEFNPQQIGLQFLGNIIGSVLGEQIAGRGSDWWMNWKTKQMNGGASGDKRPEPEFRLWLSYGGYLLSMVGLLVFGIRFQQAPQGEWNVTPIVSALNDGQDQCMILTQEKVGVAIAAAGGQVITTVLVTYAVDCHTEHSASIGAFVNVVRQTWAFIG